MICKQFLLALVISSSLIKVVVGQGFNNFGGGFGGGGFGGGNRSGGDFGGGDFGNGDDGQNQDDQNQDDQNQDDQNQDDGGDQGGDNGGGELALDPDNVQDASQNDGNADAEAGQSASLTDDANFINFCSGKELTNGLQVEGGSCNGIVMGDIPSTGNMVSTIILNPGPGDDLDEDTDFNVDLQVDNLVAGSFTNPDNTYYSAPQQLDGGSIVGHTHITIQSLGDDIATQQPPDPAEFVFFKGVNDAGDGNGGLSAAVDGGLPAGVYRVCTMASASNHQPVLMPVAQRGAQDDCQKFTVGQGGGNQNDQNQDDQNQDQNQDDQNQDQNQDDQNQDQSQDDQNQDDQNQDDQNQDGQDNGGDQFGGGGFGDGGFGGGGFGGGFGGFGKHRRDGVQKRRTFVERKFIA